jgi:predicted HTH domain antitoxin
MVVSVNVPDPIAVQLHLDGEQGNRRALEMFALEGYRSGELSRGQVSQMLEMEFNETERFLKEHNAYISMTMEEFEKDRENLERFLTR